MKMPKNMKHVSGGYYIVRTQAGFRSALKDYVSGTDISWRNLDSYPRRYPSIVHLSTGYRGYLYVEVDCIYLGVDFAIVVDRLRKKFCSVFEKLKGGTK